MPYDRMLSRRALLRSAAPTTAGWWVAAFLGITRHMRRALQQAEEVRAQLIVDGWDLCDLQRTPAIQYRDHGHSSRRSACLD
jgi:hypothetical protein